MDDFTQDLPVVARVHAGLVVGMPVCPESLLEQLHKYEDALPVLRTLQLCHRFGRGPDVHISKLPVEVRLLIEDFLVKMAPGRAKEIAKALMHFENRCDILDHVGDENYRELMSDIRETVHERLCDKCQSSAKAYPHPYCPNGCHNIVEVEMEDSLPHPDETERECLDMQAH